MNTYLNPDAIQDRSIEPIKLNSAIIEITYAELKALRDNAQLIPGQQYRITDYVTSTTQMNTTSANHQFDIIVIADSESTLNEVARAIQHDDDLYFETENVEAWQLKYCLDNDTGRFAWADTENGKGVIYRMIDEYGNDCPYDFKNIMFKHPKDTATYPGYYYTFTTLVSDVVSDHSLNNSYCYNNVIKEYNILIVAGKYGNSLNKNVFINTAPTSICYNNSFGNNCISNSFGDRCYSNSFGDRCYSNSFGNDCYSNYISYDCYSNSFGNNCVSNSFEEGCYSNSFVNECNNNSFGNECNYNSFGNDCHDNSFGNECKYNSFGNGYSRNSFVNECNNNSFGNGCNYNSFGNDCHDNSFGNECYSNSFGNECYSNSFGNECNNNSFGNYCSDNSFGNYCKGNSFRVGSSTSNNLRDYCNLNKFCDGCNNVILWNSTTASSINCLQSVNVNLIWYTGSSPSAHYTAEIGILRSHNPINVYYNGYTLLAVDYGEKWRHIISSTTLTKDDRHVICDNTSAITITLPTGWNGAEYYIHKRCSTSITNTIKTTNGQYISYGAESSTTEQRATSSASQALGTSKLIWDPSASEWIRIYLG